MVLFPFFFASCEEEEDILFLQNLWQSGEGATESSLCDLSMSFDDRNSKDNCNSFKLFGMDLGSKQGLVRKHSREWQHTNRLPNYLPFFIAKNKYRNSDCLV